ncbi:biotin synthase BioB [Nitrococcus mobilis]|uniref:Biotin synthase n=1 Tax=Nitrococcus mobilis Nb-231 TaxID=314278 RepID=A4BQS6_9GAMM|nr:biotin synthase BioB [Nitrococcus mobilis]EAR21926.1 biotin synthetase [Nitrococcus mobilis Nb-231]
MAVSEGADIRHDWRHSEVEELLGQAFNDLLFQAQEIHRRYFDPNEVQVCTLQSIKTGSCPEDCKYCPQSIRYHAGVEPEALMNVETVLAAAQKARAAGATRFCMGAAWRRPKDRDLTRVIEMVRAIKALGMETCATLGMLTAAQAQRLQTAGLDYYNHNIDTSPEYYPNVITTRTYRDRLETLAHVRAAGIKLCCGGIIGLGETRADRAGMLCTLANLPEHPQSVPINQLIQVPGTPLYDTPAVEPFEMVRVIAVSRILMPKAWIRLSAGRCEMSDETQALCFLAGANSIFYGERLLTTDNPEEQHDRVLFAKLGLRFQARSESDRSVCGAAGKRIRRPI